MFYSYNQNNSGGWFDFEKGKLSHYVIIEADSAEEADDRLIALGGYFDGCQTGQDCSCCGDRWGSAAEYGYKGDPVPSIYGRDVSSGVFVDSWPWTGDDPEGYIHYKDGRVQTITLKSPTQEKENA